VRTMITVTMPVEHGNKSIKDGTLPKLMERFMNEYKPEAAYFFTSGGTRTAQMVFDLKDPSQIPVISEMFFFGLHAHIDYKPVMNAEDLRKGLSSIDRAVMV